MNAAKQVVHSSATRPITRRNAIRVIAALCVTAVALAYWIVRTPHIKPTGGGENASLAPFAAWMVAGEKPGWDPRHQIVLVEFTDYQCPACRATQPQIDHLIAQYPKQLRLVVRNFPLTQIHPAAWNAALVAECAAIRGRSAPVRAALFRCAFAPGTPAPLDIAHAVGLDSAAVSPAVLKRADVLLERDVRCGDALGIQGVPSFYLCYADGDSDALSSVQVVASTIRGAVVAMHYDALRKRLTAKAGR